MLKVYYSNGLVSHSSWIIPDKCHAVAHIEKGNLQVLSPYLCPIIFYTSLEGKLISVRWDVYYTNLYREKEDRQRVLEDAVVDRYSMPDDDI